MIGQKRRQPTFVASSNEVASSIGTRELNVGNAESGTSSNLAHEQGVEERGLFRRSSWFCRKFWKRKTSPIEDEWKRSEASIAQLLERLSDQPDDAPSFPDEECVICVTGRASMQTYPCGHKVLCRTCLVRTLHVALQERQLPLRCVVCRRRIVHLRQQPSQCKVVVKKQESPDSYYLPPAPSPSPPSGIRHPGYM